MSTKHKAKQWLTIQHPTELENLMKASKYYSSQDLWWFTFPTSYFESDPNGYLNILLQSESNQDLFHFLKVPFSYFRKNRNRFDIRESGEKFDLHISAKTNNWLMCERSNNVSFREFEQ